MALQKNMVFEAYGQSVPINNVYIKVAKVSANKSSALAEIHFLENEKKIEEKTFGFNVSVEDGSDNFIKQAYEAMKKSHEYSDSEDV
jgi:hypothetical protein